ncbi:methylesterase 17-like [Hibiscus syriacus]|uniref:Methylesterase 17-like n=1 Tax=Hibiscus syriacus TaxID=106335 RepID=A0A6A2YR24_HIBSY|nr:methylesterase 17-like [Hibiscus syriacus]
MNTKTMRLPPRRVSMPTKKTANPVLSNQLLAGYLAHEFLTRETLFGQPFDPSPPQQSDSGRVTGEDAGPGKRSRAEDVEAEPKQKEENHRRYVEVASLLKTDGAHIPGIVNPGQLARLLQM